MLIFLAAVALTSSQQAIHDDMERKMRIELVHAHDVIETEWKPSKQLVKDYDRAEQCYTKFHLYKIKGCDAELDKLARDEKDAVAVSNQ